MTQGPTRGRRAAIRAAINRRGELGLTQEQLAERAGVSPRTIGMFETGQSWPRARQLGQIERLGLNWPVGHLREVADDIDYPAEERDQPIVIRTEDQGQLYMAGVLRRIAELEEQATTDRERWILDQLREVVRALERDEER